MYNINNISQITNTYIFFKDETRNVVNIPYLQVARTEIIEELKYINYMNKSLDIKSETINNQLKTINKSIEILEKYIDGNQNLPIVKRGLSQQHSDLETQNKKYHDTATRLGATNELIKDSFDSEYHYKKLIGQIDATIQYNNRCKVS